MTTAPLDQLRARLDDLIRQAEAGPEAARWLALRELALQAQATLEAAQAEAGKQRELLDLAREAILVSDEADRLVAANAAAGALLGYRLSELLGRPLRHLLPAEDWPAFEAQRAAADSLPRERAVLHKSAAPVPVELTLRPLADGRLYLSLRDLTAQRLAAAAYQEDAARLQAVVGALDEVAFEFDADGTFINAWTTTPDWPAAVGADVVGRPLAEVLEPAVAQRVVEAIRRALYHRRPESLEFSLPAGAEQRWFLARLAPIPSTNSFVKTVLMLARDITERQRAEAQLAQNSAEIAALYRASAQLLAPADDVDSLALHIAQTVMREFEFVGCSVLLVDEAGQELRRAASAGDYVVSGLRTLPVAGPGLTTAAFQAGRTLYAPDVQADPRYLAGDPRTRSELAVPLTAGRQALGILDLQSPQLDAFPSRLRQVMEVFADNAAQALQNARLVSNLAQARAAAEAANQLKGMFLANTSHELRTPLAVILGALDAVLQGAADTPEAQAGLVRSAHAASQRLHYLINDLLDFATLEAGELLLTLQSVDVEPLMEEVRQVLEPEARRKGLYLEWRAPASRLPAVRADAVKLRQVLAVLLHNAIKFTETGGVTLSARLDAHSLTMVVEDTGIGVALDKLALVFQPFVQGDGSTTRRRGGAGLGLALARRLTELMGGSLSLHSAGEDQGSTVHLRLPLAAA